MKRSRDQLTGGTGDVSPQLLTTGALTLSAANTFTQIQVALPVNRFQQRKGKSIVIEVLRVYFDLGEWDSVGAAVGTRAFSRCQLSTVSLAKFDPDAPQVFAYTQKIWKSAFTAGGSFESTSVDPLIWDSTDGAGHGYIVATDNLFVGADTVSFGAATSFHVKILYRFKEVNLEEYIGVVQSQQ